MHRRIYGNVALNKRRFRLRLRPFVYDRQRCAEGNASGDDTLVACRAEQLRCIYARFPSDPGFLHTAISRVMACSTQCSN